MNRPAFLDTPAKIAWWNDLTLAVQRARMAYGQKQIAQGRVLMQQATNNIAFWDKAIALARVLATPVTMAEEGATRFLSSNVFKVAIFAGLAYAAFIYWRTRPRGKKKSA